MLNLKSSFMVLLSVLLIFVSNLSNAQTLAELQQADKVRVKVWVEPEANIIARQQVNLQIEVATDKWFSGGTQIGRLEIDDAIVLQREKFAVNSSRNEDGKSWTVQLWTLVIYPLRDGVFEVPAIPLQLSIAGDNLESIEGEIFTEALSFIVNMPEQQAVSDRWIATSRFEVEESFDKNTDELATGDALIRTIKLSADNLPAMMLPEVVVDDIPGIAVYEKPPQLTDKVNRGDYIAERTQTITYVFEKSGEYLLQKQTYWWWNLETHTFETIELAEHVLTIHSDVNPAAPTIKTAHKADNNKIEELLPLFIKAGITILLLVLGVWVVRKYRVAHEKNKTVQHSESELRKQFDNACAKNDYERAIGVLYQWLDFYSGKDYKGSIRNALYEMNQLELMALFKDIMQSIYADDKSNDVDIKLFARQFINELKAGKNQTISSRLSVDLRLN